MKTAIRFDDIRIGMNYKNFNRVRNILVDNKLTGLLGVVPFPDETKKINEEERLEFLGLLFNLKHTGWIFAMHGWKHVYTTKKKGIFPLNNFSEFAGIPYKKQLSMIREASEQMGKLGIQTDIFMAPAHTYDRKTLKALRECGITRMTDGFGLKPYIYRGITFYPIAKRRIDCISDKPGITTLVLHTDTMTEQDIDDFEKMIKENRSHFISYSEYLTAKPWKRNEIEKLVEYWQALAKYYLIKRRTKNDKGITGTGLS